MNNRRTLFLPAVLAAVLFLQAGCRRTEPVLPPLTAEEISGERFWQRIREDSDYRDYSQWKGHDGMRPGQSPHGVQHQVYVNRTLYDAMPVGGGTAPDGTVIVKENYSSAGDLVKITAMVKVAGYDPENNDWFWAAFDPDGTVGAEGSPMGCVSCHEGLRSNDFIIIKSLDEEP